MRCRLELLFPPAIAVVVTHAACSSSGTAGVAAAAATDAGSEEVGDDRVAWAPRPCPEGSALTYENFGAPFFLNHCTSCHSSALPDGSRRGAPLDANFDAIENIRARGGEIFRRAADEHTIMPPAGGPSAEQRRLLGDWLVCGAPGEPILLDAGAGGGGPRPSLSGACAGPHPPLPSAILPRCAASTRACVLACPPGADEACDDGCYAADPTPPDTTLGYPVGCKQCVDAQLLACADASGCHVPLAEFLCCLAERCPAGSAPTCAAQQCQSALEALGYCVFYAAPSCVDLTSGPLVSRCFPPADAGSD